MSDGRTRKQEPGRVGRPGVMARAFTAIEFLIAISITALIAAAVTGLLMAIAQASELEEDRREAVVRAQAVDVRLSSYVAPSRCVLQANDRGAVLWLDDSRETGTVNLSEIRWIHHDLATDAIVVSFVSIPADWTELQREAADTELPLGSDWWEALEEAEEIDLVVQLRLCDRVTDLEIEHDASTSTGERLVTFRITFGGQTGERTIVAAAGIRELEEPTS